MTWRDVGAGELRSEHVGERRTLAGWVARRRDHGGLVFIDLRDATGISQLVVNPERSPEAAAAAHDIRNEFVLRAEGEVAARAEENVNPNLPTGEVELQVDKLDVVSTSPPLPFQLDEENVDETLRFRYRWLDLRRDKLQRNIRLRAKAVSVIRREMEAAGFVDIETPIMAKPTPEGARDFLVPTRLQKGRFFALPQSPQIYKQLLVISGFERYYQIARCFRDEDVRADRVQELTQLDLEMAFPDREYIFELIERTFSAVWRETIGEELPTPFPRMPYADAMLRYGSDKPDLRFGLEIEDATEATRGSEFKVFADAPAVRFLRRAPGALARRPREARGVCEGVGREGARVHRLRRGRRAALADREVPVGGGALDLPRRARDDGAVRRRPARDRRPRPRERETAARTRARPDRRGSMAAALGDGLSDVRLGRGRRALEGEPPSVHRADPRVGADAREGSGPGDRAGLRLRRERQRARVGGRSGSTGPTFSNGSSTCSTSRPKSSVRASVSSSTPSAWEHRRTGALLQVSTGC